MSKSLQLMLLVPALALGTAAIASDGEDGVLIEWRADQPSSAQNPAPDRTYSPGTDRDC